ncbi:MAG: CHAT domain-containing protein [Bacteroidota bacterium]
MHKAELIKLKETIWKGVIIIIPFFYFCSPCKLWASDSLKYELYLEQAKIKYGKAEYDSSVFYGEKVMEESFKTGNWDVWYKGMMYGVRSYYTKKEFDKIVALCNEGIEIISEARSDSLLLAKLHGWVGFSYYYLENEEKILESNLRAIRILEAIGKQQEGISYYQNAGIEFTKIGEYDKAISYLKNAEQYSLELDKISKLYLIWTNLAIAYKSKGNFEEYIKICKKVIDQFGLEFREALNLAEAYRKLGNTDEAREYLKSARELMKSEPGQRFNYLKELAEFFRKENPKQIEQTYLEAIDEAIKSPEVSKRELAKVKIDLAKYYIELNKFDDAKNHFKESLKLLDSTFVLKDFEHQKEIKSLKLSNGVWIMESLYGLAQCTEGLIDEENKNTLLEKAKNYYVNSFFVIDFLRLSYDTEESKLLLSGYVNSIYEDGLNFIYEHSSHFENQDEINDIILFTLEKSRSFVLSSTLKEVKAKAQTGIPDSLLEKEKILVQSIFEWERETLNQHSGNDSLFSLKRELEDLNRYFEDEYPLYFKSKFASTVPSTEIVQQQYLADNQACLYYFWGKNGLFIALLTKSRLSLRKIAVANISEVLSTYLNALKNRDFDSDPKFYFEQLTNASFELYQHLIEDNLITIDAGVDELILLPDGALNYLPFESLLTKEPGDEIRFSMDNLDYLLEEYAISYSFSLDFLFSMKDNENVDFSSVYSGFAPSFIKIQGDGSRRSCTVELLSELKFNKSEVENIHSIVGGNNYVGAEASLKHFLVEAQQSKVLHLATHACANSENVEDNRIYFSDEEFLTTYDIYQLETKAEMVVLSACETGIGKYEAGEGVMSLARSFAFAGTPSIIMSLWAIPDRSTSTIMADYYKYLEMGMKKSKALQNAKLDFLSSTDYLYQHPHYWASMVVIGNSDKIDMKTFTFEWYYFAIVFVFLFAAVWAMRKRST